MSLLCPQLGEVTLLTNMLPTGGGTCLILHLYGNDCGTGTGVPYGAYLYGTTPPSGGMTTYVMNELQSSNSGNPYYGSATYAAQNLTGTWTLTKTSSTTTAVYNTGTGDNAVQFSIGSSPAGVTAYGYYVTDHSGNLLWGERFTGAPFQLPTGGGTIEITPQIQLA